MFLLPTIKVMGYPAVHDLVANLEVVFLPIPFLAHWTNLYIAGCFTASGLVNKSVGMVDFKPSKT